MLSGTIILKIFILLARPTNHPRNFTSYRYRLSRAEDRHLFLADPDVFISAESGCFSNADLDPALKTCKQTPNEDFSVVEKDKKKIA